MKKITKILLGTCLALAVSVMVLAGGVSAAKPELATMPPEEDVITVVGILGIMNGDYYGNLNLDNYVTRAEFTKMALNASSLKNSVNTASRVSPFADVSSSHWASGYIVTAVTNGYLRGYADGSFKPSGNVTLEEAVTVMLRILGYTELDSGKYPSAQLSKYTDMKLDNRIPAVQGQALTRRECMYLIYNCLCAETKNGNIHCQTLGYSADSNGRIDYLALINSNMQGPVTVYDDGKYTEAVGLDLSSATIYRDGKEISASDIKPYDQVYYNRDIRTVWCFSEKAVGTVNAITVAGITSTSEDYTASGSANADSIVIDGKSYQLGNTAISHKLSQSAGQFKCDDFVMLMLDKDGKAGDIVHANEDIFNTYVTKDEDKLAVMDAARKGPYVVTDTARVKDAIPFDLAGASIYYGTKTVSASDISLYDVYYYSEPFKSVWLYRDNAIGIVDAVNVSGVTSVSDRYSGSSPASGAVIISGKSYTLGNEDVKYKLSAYGSFGTDDFVMVLLDKNGAVADIVNADSTIVEKFLDEDDDRVALINSTLKGPYILKDGETLGEKLPFDMSGVKIYHGTKVVDVSYAKANDVYYYSEPFASIWIYRDTATGFVNAVSPSRENPTSITVGSKNYTLDGATVKQQFSNFGTFEVDDFVTILLGNGGTAVYATAGDIYEYAASNKDGVSYTDIVNQSMDGPIIAKPGKSWQDELPFDYTSATYYKKNAVIKSSEIKDYDVIYYSKALSSVWVYTDKATGVFEGVSPNRISPTSVTISGKSYSIESTGAGFALSNMGTYSYGDTITLLLGKNGGAVEVVSGTETSASTYGFITAFGESTYTKPNGVTYTAESITVLGTDTVTHTYEYDDAGFTKGDFVSVTTVDGKIKIKKVTSGASSTLTATVNSLISSGSIADDAVLMDVYITTDSDSLENKSVKYSTFFPARLTGAKLKSSDIFYAEVENGKITELVLNDFTGDIHTYGVITAERSGTSMDYYLICGGSETRITINTAYGTPDLGAASALVRSGKHIIKNLDGAKVEKSDFGRASSASGGKTYHYASNVEFYIKESAREFVLSTYDDIMEGNYRITVYYDDTAENGGRVRIIIAE
ncbi:MAG: S-layer homology domain-containing protein [Clostridia bacterium]|nr:S-layer homology domain-containing protein [Clostridia bacterium]